MAEYIEYQWNRRQIISDSAKKDPNLDNIDAIHALRSLIQHSTDFELKSTFPQDDKTLRKFLYARNFNIPDTWDLVQNYFWYRKRNEAIFQCFNVDAADIKQSLENCLPGVLPMKDRKGHCVLILYANNWDCSNYTLISIYRALLLSLEVLARDIHNQARGFVIIVDWTEFSFRQSINLKPSMLKMMIEGLQDCFPAKFKGIHFIGQPWYVEAALTVIKQFLHEKVKDRIFVHGNNLSTLHDLVHKDVLPAELGGEQPSYNPESWLKTLQDELAMS